MKYFFRLFLFLLILSVVFFYGCTKDNPDTPVVSILSISGVSSVSAGVGDTIVIYGNYFAPLASGNSVKLNLITVNILSATFNQIAIQVPPGIGSGNVVVSVSANSQTASYTFAFTRLAGVSSFAGNGTPGYLDGNTISAIFNLPSSLAIDRYGNLFVTDGGNNRIRKITAAGAVSTFAGSGIAGFTDATGTGAYFNNPNGVTVDIAGNVYVADMRNNRIRKISANGVVSTLAGNGMVGSTDDTAAKATFNSPYSIVVDPNNGNLYVGDLGNRKIRKVTPAGIVSTYAGTGVTGSQNGSILTAQFDSPLGLALDAAGNLYVADGSNNKIRKITISNNVINTTTFVGDAQAGLTDGTSAVARFNYPSGITIDASGNLYVADLLNNAVRKVTPAGVVTTLAGNVSAGYKDGSAAYARFYHPSGVVTDAAGNVYVVDNGNSTIRKITP